MLEPTKTPIGTAWIDAEGILWHRLDFGVRVSGELARKTARAMAEILSDRPAPAIVDISGIQFAEDEAREVFAHLGSGAAEVATAVLLQAGDNPVPAILADLFAKLEADRPVAFFECEKEAVAWAREFLGAPPPA
jgi:hypothetical protein